MTRSATHKAERKRAAAIAEQEHKHPFLLGLLHKREQMDADTMPRRDGHVIRPEVSKGKVDKAARAMADWENSDPFSYGRTALYVRQGYLDPEEVIKETQQRTLARRVAKEREIEREQHNA